MTDIYDCAEDEQKPHYASRKPLPMLREERLDDLRAFQCHMLFGERMADAKARFVRERIRRDDERSL